MSARKPGRPRKAARSLAEAQQAVRDGVAPNRPRNEFERQARPKGRRGRPAKPQARTTLAAELAVYLFNGGDERSLTAAVRVAAQWWNVNARNVRRIAGKLVTEKTVVVSYRGDSPILRGATMTIPFVVVMEDVTD